jgi:hypothetical protein
VDARSRSDIKCECGVDATWWIQVIPAAFMGHRRASCDDHLGLDIIRDFDVQRLDKVAVWPVMRGRKI